LWNIQNYQRRKYFKFAPKLLQKTTIFGLKLLHNTYKLDLMFLKRDIPFARTNL